MTSNRSKPERCEVTTAVTFVATATNDAGETYLTASGSGLNEDQIRAAQAAGMKTIPQAPELFPELSAALGAAQGTARMGLRSVIETAIPMCEASVNVLRAWAATADMQTYVRHWIAEGGGTTAWFGPIGKPMPPMPQDFPSTRSRYHGLVRSLLAAAFTLKRWLSPFERGTETPNAAQRLLDHQRRDARDFEVEGMDVEVIGAIVGGPEIRRRFIDLIGEDQSLVTARPRPGINPFTKEPVVIEPRKDFAWIVIDGKCLGYMECSPDGSDLINVWSRRGVVESLAREIAHALGGQMTESLGAGDS
jgi:hypothetical protein